MGSIGPSELLIVAAVAMLLFGGGSRIADLGKGFGQAIKNFKQGLRDPESSEKERA